MWGGLGRVAAGLIRGLIGAAPLLAVRRRARGEDALQNQQQQRQRERPLEALGRRRELVLGHHGAVQPGERVVDGPGRGRPPDAEQAGPTGEVAQRARLEPGHH